MNRPLTNKQLALRALRYKARVAKPSLLRARHAFMFNLCEIDRKEGVKVDKAGYRVDIDCIKEFRRLRRREEGIAELKKLIKC